MMMASSVRRWSVILTSPSFATGRGNPDPSVTVDSHSVLTSSVTPHRIETIDGRSQVPPSELSGWQMGGPWAGFRQEPTRHSDRRCRGSGPRTGARDDETPQPPGADPRHQSPATACRRNPVPRRRTRITGSRSGAAHHSCESPSRPTEFPDRSGTLGSLGAGIRLRRSVRPA